MLPERTGWTAQPRIGLPSQFQKAMIKSMIAEVSHESWGSRSVVLKTNRGKYIYIYLKKKKKKNLSKWKQPLGSRLSRLVTKALLGRGLFQTLDLLGHHLPLSFSELAFVGKRTTQAESIRSPLKGFVSSRCSYRGLIFL